MTVARIEEATSAALTLEEEAEVAEEGAEEDTEE